MSKSESSSTLVFYASQSGKETLDEGDGGGNPFASALIELLERPSLTYAELHSDIVGVTEEKSGGFQVPEAPTVTHWPQWQLKPVLPSVKRVALVFVYSDYDPAGANCLPGARRDLRRVAEAFRSAGFDVQTATDPTRTELLAALEALSRQSEEAESAVIYLTGHGFEHGDTVYLMPNDYPLDETSRRLSELALDVRSLGTSLNASSANIVLFGGCRTHLCDLVDLN